MAQQPLTEPGDGGDLSARQREVLDATLALMVEAGDALTMAAIAERASCSKETLYKWFGDRDGLLTATVQWQASKVRLPALDRASLNAETLRRGLADFAENWLKVLTGEMSIALNSIAIAHASGKRSRLGEIVLYNGPFAMGRRIRPVLELARSAGLLRFSDSDQAFRVFFGLVVRDVQIRVLLGERPAPDADTLRHDAKAAAEQFFALYGRNGNPQTPDPSS